MNRVRIAKIASLAALVAPLGGCGSFNWSMLNPLSWWSGPPAERAQTLPSDATAYACDGAKKLVVRYLSGEKSVMIVFPEREFRLDQTASGSGIRYTNGTTTLSSKDDDVTLEESGSVTFANCRKTAT